MFGKGNGRGGFTRQAALATVIFVAGLAAGYALRPAQEPVEEPDKEIRPGRVGFTNPLLDCEVGVFPRGKELRPFRGELAQLVSDIVARGEAAEVAVYFRDLDNGPWFGVDERKAFTPGSLLKVPLMMAALLQATRDPAFLDQRIRFQGLPVELGLEAFESKAPLVRGQTYTVEQLIERVAVHSDNHAAWLLFTAVDPHVLDRLYRDLGLDPTPARNPALPATVSPRAFGSLFRVLYNASYLNREMSDKLLEMMSRAAYRDGLVAGVPPGTVVAHKFGVNTVGEPGLGEMQLHDCGIVYNERRPYFLCVMTRGSDERLLGNAIEQTSRLVWERATRVPYSERVRAERQAAGR